MSEPLTDSELRNVALLRLLAAADAVVNAGDGPELSDIYSELESAVHFARQSPEVQAAAVAEILKYFQAQQGAGGNGELDAAVKTVKRVFPDSPFHVAVAQAVHQSQLYEDLLPKCRQWVAGSLSKKVFEEAISLSRRSNELLLGSLQPAKEPRR